MTCPRRRHRPSCRLCGSSGLVTVLDLGKQALTGVFPASAEEHVTKGPLELVWCSSCTLLQLAHGYEPTEMYGDNYGYRSGLNRSMGHISRARRAGSRRSSASTPGDVVLDIGSNDGTLLGGVFHERRPAHRHRPDRCEVRELLPADAKLVPDFFSAPSFREVSDTPARIVTSIAMFYDLEDPIAFAATSRSASRPTASGTSSRATCRRCCG